MNILQIITKLDTSDGAEDVIASTRFLTINGHKVVVASPESKSVRKIDEVGARHYPISFESNILLLPFFISQLSKIILKENIDIIHARGTLSSFVAFFASRFTGRSFISTVYGRDKYGFFGRTQFWAKRVICFSQAEAHNLIEEVHLSKSKVRVIPPFVSSDEKAQVAASRPGNCFTIGAVVCMSSSEIAQIFVRAISILYRKINKIKVLISNSNPTHTREDEERFKLLARRHSLDGIFTFLSRGEESLLSKPDLFVQADIDQNLPSRISLKAHLLGIPVVTTPIDWIKEHISDDKRIFLTYSPDDPEDLASTIFNLYKNENLKNELADEAKKFVKDKFNIGKIMKSTIEVYEDAISSINILIIKVGALGDVILSVPSLRAVRKKFPKSKITVLVGIDSRDALMDSPYIDEILVCDFKKRDSGLKGILCIGKRLRAEDFDIVVDLQNNKRSHLLSFLSCAANRFGYDNGKLSFLLNRKIKDRRSPIDPIEHQAKVLGLLGIYDIDKNLELWPSREDEAWVDNFLKSHWVRDNKKIIALNISSSPRWVTKLWPLEYFIEVCDRLAQSYGIRAVLIGLKDEDSQLEKFLKVATCKPIDAVGKTNIPHLVSLIKRCSLLLSSDSAPIHIAASVGTPFIALFGPTDPKRHLAPAKNCIVFKKDLPCSPCYHTYCNRGYKCMRSITPDEVYDGILDLLNIKK